MTSFEQKFKGNETPTFINVILEQNQKTINLPSQYSEYVKKIWISSIYWNLFLPREDVDPSDPSNFVQYYASDTVKTSPVYLHSRNPGEGFYSTQFQNLSFKVVNKNISFDEQGNYTNIFGVFEQKANSSSNTKGFLVNEIHIENPIYMMLDYNENSFVIEPYISWLRAEYFPDIMDTSPGKNILVSQIGGVTTIVPKYSVTTIPLFQQVYESAGSKFIQRPVTGVSMNWGAGLQPIWNRPVFLKLGILYS